MSAVHDDDCNFIHLVDFAHDLFLASLLTASAAGEAILPYFSDIMTQLKRFLTLEGHAGGDAETTLKLQQEAIGDAPLFSLQRTKKIFFSTCRYRFRYITFAVFVFNFQWADL